VAAKGEEVTELTVDGTYSVTGPLETFANAGGVHVARALLAEFSKNMAGLVAERRAKADGPAAAGSAGEAAGTGEAGPQQSGGPAATNAGTATGGPAPTPAAATSAPPRVATELSATKLLWMAFLSWLRQLMRKGK
jgi:hypothetical protein